MNRTILLALLPLLLFTLPPAGAAASDSHAEPFPFPNSLRPAVDFWKDVFTDYDNDQVVIFDAYDVGRIYEVRRIPTPDGTRRRERLREQLRSDFKKSIADAFEELTRPDVDYDALEGRLYRLHTIWDYSRDPEVYRAAAENVRSQRGIRESFLGGVARSTRYLDQFRDILREEGVPEDLVYLPHVESSYRRDARSGVGAVGMWQFMSYTGKKYLRIDDMVDERLDPHASARAAARFLLENYQQLGTWPLTITAYNQGTSAMMNARLTLGTDDIERVIREYRGARFGFMGRNFYAEFLAAREASEEILRNPAAHGVIPEEPVVFDTWTLPAYVKLSPVADAFRVSDSHLAELNPGLSAGVRGGRDYLPKGYSLRVPAGFAAEAGTRFASIPAAQRHAQRPVRTYKVRKGDTLGTVAARFGTSIRSLQRLNGIRNPNQVRIGQVLRLPTR